MTYGGYSSPGRTLTRSGEKVAIIGSGPAGLSCAYYLADSGYQATIFEALSQPGGMMRLALPRFRLTETALDAEINQIKSAGVKILTNHNIDSLDDLSKQGFRAIFIASGAHKGSKLGIEGEDSPGVIDGISFLRQVNLCNGVALGKRVAIIGGGNAAIDAARTALRVGSREVSLIYRRNRTEMPAADEEIDDALAEGVKMLFLAAPKRIVSQADHLTVEYIRMKLGKPDAGGRPRPEPVKGSEFKLDFVSVIVATGQTPEVPEQFRLTTVKGGRIKIDPNSLATQREGVFAGGDVVTGPASVVAAISAGRQAALSIDCYLKGKPVPKEAGLTPVEELPEAAAERVIKRERQRVPELKVEERVSNFEAVEQGYTREMAVREAGRCLNCGVGARIVPDKCAICLNCVRLCPYGAAGINPTGDVEIGRERCIACGLCAAECPARAIELAPPGLSDIESSLKTALKQPSGGVVILGLVCAYNTLALEMKNHPRVRLISIPCTSRLAVDNLLKAFELGADGVFTVACGDGDCRYQDAGYRAELKVAETRRILGQVGLGEESLRLFKLSPTDSEELDKLIAEFTKIIEDCRL